MNLAGDTLAKPSRRTPRGRFGLPRDVWWGSITALVVFVLAPFAVTVFALLAAMILPPVGVFMAWVGLPHFMLAYPFLTWFKGNALLAYGLTVMQLVPQSVLFGWLTRRRSIEQQLLLALVALTVLAIAMSVMGVMFGIESLIVRKE